VRCPWCREQVPALARAAQCPHCGKNLQDERGEAVRTLDLEFDAILADADARSLLWTRRGVAFALGAALFSLVPGPGAAVSAVLLGLGQLFWCGFLVSRPYHRHFGPMRRLVTRWVRRLATLLVVLPLHASTFVPGLGLLTAPAVFFGACWATREYGRFHLLRERRRDPILFLEKALVFVLAACLLGGLCTFGVLLWLGILVLGGGE
jgi:hypothetical protein